MLLFMTGFVKANNSTQVISKLKIAHLHEAHLICVPFCMVGWLRPFFFFCVDKMVIS